MKINPLITVYVTNYNYEEFLVNAIESVLNQTMVDFELLIIDDGSTDNSREIMESYRKYDCVSLIYQQNKGLNITNNVAMRLSKAKYLMRLDADDFLEPTALEVLSNSLESNPELGLVFPDYFYVDKNGVRIGEEKRHNFDKDVSLYDQPAHGACTMVRLSFLKVLGGYNESFSCQDGYDLWLKFITHHKVSNINTPLFSYRQHGNNLTKNEQRILDTRRSIKEYFFNKTYKKTPSLVVIPVRSIKFNNETWALFSFNGKTILQDKVDTCLQANSTSAVIVISEDDEILEFCNEKLKHIPNFYAMRRPEVYAAFNKPLRDTVSLAVDYARLEKITFSNIVTVSLDFPFIKSSVLDEISYTQSLFNSDSVISVRPDNRIYYSHTGHSLEPILDQDKFTKLEREALYRGAGGLVLTTITSFNKNKELKENRISHVIIDEESSFGIFTIFDFNLFKIIKKEKDFITVRQG